ncbi:MAG: helix-turn-helix domain-containing protein [Nocardioides sp.]
MNKKTSYNWHLREVMATRGLFQTSDLVPLLAERGIDLSREQVYRLVVQTPQRLSLDILAACCDILDCGPQDLIEVTVVNQQVRKASASSSTVRDLPIGRTRIRRPGD